MKDIKQYIKEMVGTGIFEAIGDGVSIQDTDFKILYQNRVHIGLVGEHTGEYCYEAYEKRGNICKGCPVAKSFKDGEIHKAERTAPTDNGTLYVDITASPLMDSTGKVIAGIEIARNITERKKAEEKIKSLARFPTENPNPTLRINSNNEVIYMNEPVYIQLKEQGLSEKDIYKILPDNLIVLIQETLTKNQPIHMKEVIVGKKVFSYNIIPISDQKYVNLYGRDITELKKAEEVIKENEKKLHALSITDELTGLNNRRGFFTLAEQQLKQSIRDKKGIYLVLADLDHLKKINDNLGHHEGDVVLIKTANLLKESFRESDIIARIGGDEFVILVNETSETTIDSITFRLIDNIKTYNNTKNKKYKLSLSIGVVHNTHEEPLNLDKLIDKADKLMYEQKKIKKES